MKSENLDRFYKFHSVIYDITRVFFLPCRAKAVKLLKPMPNDTIIDFGCGTGYNLKKIYNLSSETSLVGVDLSSHMLKKASKKIPSAKYYKHDIGTINIKYKAEKIISSYALSMVPDWQKVILNMKKHLKKNGTLVIADFYKFSGFLKIFYPPFSLWLKAHGVTPHIEITDFLKIHFKNVEESIFYSGYAFIVKAKDPV
ncbi:MAG: class I SAM-dependent methyltransferase [Spirochaetia bacterium]|nr:class I SAM-dependent methyltransferase [Spirochaetia bacterium]